MKSISIISILLLLCSCQNPKDSHLQKHEFKIPNAYDLEIICKEPTVNAPVCMDFDEKGRIWIVEMRSYMPNIEGSNEKSRNNSIKILEDENHDGIFEQAKIFLDDLILPRSILHAYGGLVYSEPPNLWHIEINNDRPGKKTLIDSTYAVDGNVEHQPSALTLNMDNWIYSSSSNVRYQKKKGKWIKEYTTPRGQWGMTNDNFGRLIYNNNSTLIAHDEIIPNALFSNEYLKLKENICQIITDHHRVYPLQATAVNRGYQEGVLDSNEYLINTTSACSPVFNRNKHINDWNHSAFVCIPEINAIKKLEISQDGFSNYAIQKDTSSEYIITMDEGFRPVDLKIGPDGFLYIADMHRGIIQHKAYMTSYLREKILGKKLDTITEMGRILRFKPSEILPLEMNDISVDPIALLYSNNAFYRDKAQHYIIQNNKQELAEKIRSKLKTENVEINILHSIWTLEGLNILLESDLIPLLEKDMLHVSYHALYLLSKMNIQNKDFLKLICNNLIKKKVPELDRIMAHFIGKLNLFSNEELFDIYKTIIARSNEAAKSAEGIIANHPKNKVALLTTLSEQSSLNFSSFKEILETTLERKREGKEVYYYNDNLNLEDRRTVGMELYRTFCATCHGIDGEGQNQLAPKLIDSKYVAGDEDRLILITLHGMIGPINIDGKQHQFSGEMTGLNDNEELSDTDIKDILHFVRNAFTSAPYSIEESRINELRKIKPANGGSFTSESLDSTIQTLKKL